MSRKVCITGGTGMIGTALLELLGKAGYDLSVLSRSDNPLEEAMVYTWDIQKGELDMEALTSTNYLVHLAGASIAGGKWTVERKKEIRDSRIKSTRLLLDKLSQLDKRPSVFIATSAIGVYGHNTGGILIDEHREKPGDDFLATITKEWEEEMAKIENLGIRLVILRPGIVLSMAGGALPRMVKPVQLGVGAPIGTGDQYISWIHIDDLCQLIQFAIENEQMKGIYNAVAPNPESNKDFTRKIAETLNKPFFMPNIPPFVLRLLYGEMASTIIGGNRVSSEKVIKEGFTFHFTKLEDALYDLLKN